MAFPAPMKLVFSTFKDVATLLTALITGGTFRRSYTFNIATQGTTATASIVDIQAVDASGNNLAGVHPVRVRVCNDGAHADSTNATVGATGGGGASVAEVLTTDIDLVFLSDANGRVKIDVTDATAETVTLRTGAALSGPNADHVTEIDVTHAAP